MLTGRCARLHERCPSDARLGRIQRLTDDEDIDVEDIDVTVLMDVRAARKGAVDERALDARHPREGADTRRRTLRDSLQWERGGD